ncbi:MAG: hypothetical protein ACI30R_08180 [Sodaliphilus sp.]
MKIKSIILIFTLSLIFSVSALAEKVQVTGTNVNLRHSPSLNGSVYCNGYGVPIHPQKGEILYWTGTAKNGFMQVHYNGVTLWIHSDYAKPVRSGSRSSSSYSVPSKVRITGNSVLLRYGPGQQYDPLTNYGQRVHLYKGQVLTCVGVNGDWWRVVYGGSYYYVSRRYAVPY